VFTALELRGRLGGGLPLVLTEFAAQFAIADKERSFSCAGILRKLSPGRLSLPYGILRIELGALAETRTRDGDKGLCVGRICCMN
jgi:hypothetical protein